MNVHRWGSILHATAATPPLYEGVFLRYQLLPLKSEKQVEGSKYSNLNKYSVWIGRSVLYAALDAVGAAPHRRCASLENQSLNIRSPQSGFC